MDLFVASIGFGLVTASVLAIAAVGFTMQFGITQVLNLAFGSIMTLSAFVAYALNQVGVNIWIGVVVAGVCGALASLLLNTFLISPFKNRRTSPIAMAVVTLAAGLIIENLVLAIAGPNNVSYTLNSGPTFQMGTFTLNVVEIVIIVISVVMMLVINAILKRSKIGKAMRATATNASLARASGIRTAGVIRATWLMTGFLCGLSGAVFAINDGSFGPSSVDLFLVVIIAAVVVGGVGRPYGAMLGALLLGLIIEVSASLINPSYKEVVAFVILLLTLAFRPEGLLVRRQSA